MLPAESLIDSVCTPNPVPENITPGALYATHSGTLKLGEMEIACHILNNGERVFDSDDVQKYFKEIQEFHTATDAAYQNLFNFFNQEHGLTLLQGEMDEIIAAVETFKKEYNASI